jgi:hypothetical protein
VVAGDRRSCSTTTDCWQIIKLETTCSTTVISATVVLKSVDLLLSEDNITGPSMAFGAGFGKAKALMTQTGCIELIHINGCSRSGVQLAESATITYYPPSAIDVDHIYASDRCTQIV